MQARNKPVVFLHFAFKGHPCFHIEMRNMKAQPTFNKKDLAGAMNLMRALVHPLRLRMMKYLLKLKDGASVTQIHKALKIEQAMTSQHLRVLRDVGLVTRERRKRFIYYMPNRERIEEIVKLIEQYT